MARQFDFYEIVIITSLPSEEDAATLGKSGHIAGFAEGIDGERFYAVFVYDLQECWYLPEMSLTSTHQFEKEENVWSGESLRIRVDSVIGETILKEQEYD